MPRHRHDPSKNLVGFLAGEVMYAVRIEMVREIVNPLWIHPLPRAPRSVLGVADYRGVVVPVIDLRERFGLPPVQVSRKTKWIVLDVAPPVSTPGAGPPSLVAGRYAGLVVDAVTEVFGYGAGGIRPAPPLGHGDDIRGIEGVTTFGADEREKLVFVLDARAFAAVTEAALGSEIPPGVLSGTL
jgi:purine-binding chemotaxis protein CheW